MPFISVASCSILVGEANMESFLDRAGSSLGDQLDQSKVENKTKPFLFNPQPRQRKHVPSFINEHPCGDRGHHGFGGASNYWKLRTAKLREQAPAAASQIFAGLSFYFNGRTGDKQTLHLKSAVSKHGGRTTPVMSMRGVTHVIAENLSAIKTNKAMKSLKMKVVHPDWVKMCIAEGRLLPDAPYRVVRSQELGVADFFSFPSSSSSASVSFLDASEAESANVGGSAKKGEHNMRRRLRAPSLSTLGPLTGRSDRGDHTSNLFKTASREGKDKKKENVEILRGKGADVAPGSSTAVNKGADLLARRGSYRDRDVHGRVFDGCKEGKSVIDLSCLESGGGTKVTDRVGPKRYEASLSNVFSSEETAARPEKPLLEALGAAVGKRSRDDASHGTPRRIRKIATASRLTLDCT